MGWIRARRAKRESGSLRGPRSRRCCSLACLGLSAILSVSLYSASAQASLFERPAGEDYDFSTCWDDPRIPHQLDACATLGVITCDGRVTGTGFHAETEGRKPVIVTAAHVFINFDSKVPYQRCEFTLFDSAQSIQISRAILFSKTAERDAQLPDAALAELGDAPPFESWRIPLQSVDDEQLRHQAASGDIIFTIVSINIKRDQQMVTSYPCAVFPKRPGYLVYGNDAYLLHNCPSIGGVSGSPVMQMNRESRHYRAVCIHSGGHGPKDRHPFDPRTNANICSVITPYFIEQMNKLSKGKPIEEPEGGRIIVYE